MGPGIPVTRTTTRAFLTLSRVTGRSRRACRALQAPSRSALNVDPALRLAAKASPVPTSTRTCHGYGCTAPSEEPPGALGRLTNALLHCAACTGLRGPAASTSVLADKARMMAMSYMS